MPPRKRAAAKKPSFTAADLRNAKKMSSLADFFGFDTEKFVETARDMAPIIQEYNSRASKEAEAVLLFVSTRGKQFKKKNCKWCKMEFYHTYTIVAFCSDNCRQQYLTKVDGIPWNPEGKSDIERWDNREPLVIGPYGTIAVDEWLEKNPEQLTLPEEFWPKPPKPSVISAEEELEKLLFGD